MKIIRVFNNNIVATMTKDKKEAVVQGSGVGFRKSPGDTVDQAKIEKYFPIQDNELNKFQELFSQTPIEYFHIAEAIVDEAQEFLEVQVHSQVILSLSDHIYYAVQREKEGMSIPNLMLDETRVMYKDEFEVGYWSLGVIKKVTGVELPEDEAAYIALHLFNASMDLNTEITTNIILMTKGILDIIRDVFSIELNIDEFRTARLITHLKFLALRILKNTNEDLGNIDDLYDMLLARNKLMEDCLIQVNEYVQKNYHYSLSKEEQVYLMVHIVKILN